MSVCTAGANVATSCTVMSIQYTKVGSFTWYKHIYSYPIKIQSINHMTRGAERTYTQLYSYVYLSTYCFEWFY